LASIKNQPFQFNLDKSEILKLKLGLVYELGTSYIIDPINLELFGYSRLQVIRRIRLSLNNKKFGDQKNQIENAELKNLTKEFELGE
jgi:hypothetical protein